MSVFNDIKLGLNQAIEYEKGNLELEGNELDSMYGISDDDSEEEQ